MAVYILKMMFELIIRNMTLLSSVLLLVNLVLFVLWQIKIMFGVGHVDIKRLLSKISKKSKLHNKTLTFLFELWVIFRFLSRRRYGRSGNITRREIWNLAFALAIYFVIFFYVTCKVDWTDSCIRDCENCQDSNKSVPRILTNMYDCKLLRPRAKITNNTEKLFWNFLASKLCDL